MFGRPIVHVIFCFAAAIGAVVAACVAGVAAVTFDRLDSQLIDKADAAGWNTSLLLPHENLLWVTINGAFGLLVLVALCSIAALVTLALRTRRSRKSAAGIPPRLSAG